MDIIHWLDYWALCLRNLPLGLSKLGSIFHQNLFRKRLASIKVLGFRDCFVSCIRIVFTLITF